MFQSFQERFEQHKRAIGIVLIITILAGMLASAVSATEQSLTDRNVQAWIALLNDEQETAARLGAQQQLERAGEPAVDGLLIALNSQNPVQRRNAAEVLGYIAAPRSTDALRIALAGDPDPRVRVEAVWALSQLNNAALLGSLERASLLDPDSQVRKAATDAIDGLRWSMASLADKDVKAVRVVTTAPSRPETVYLATPSEILVSENGGKIWTPSSPTASPAVTLAVSPASPAVVYAGTASRGLYKSENRGATWTQLSETLAEQAGMPVSATAIAIDPDDANHLYVAKATWIGMSQARLFPLGVVESRDGGATWQPKSFPSAPDVITRLILEGQTLYGLAGDSIHSTEK